MKSLLTVVQNKTLLFTGLAASWLEIAFLPKPMMLLLLVFAMIIDLITGLIKSWKKGVATASAGFQRSVVKLSRYVSVVIGVWLLANVLGNMSGAKVDYTYFVNACIGFLSFIEIYSIFENVYEIDPAGPLSKWFVGPVLKFLRGKLKNNPIEKLQNTENDVTN